MEKGKSLFEGRKHSEETKVKMRASSTHHWKGKKKSEETKRKISESKKGSIPWNKGLTKEDPRIRDYTRRGGITRRGMPNWRKGIGKYPKGYGRKQITIDGKAWRMSHYVYCKANNLEEIPIGYCIHHIDGNHANNEIKNLKLMKNGSHTRLHIKICHDSLHN